MKTKYLKEQLTITAKVKEMSESDFLHKTAIGKALQKTRAAQFSQWKMTKEEIKSIRTNANLTQNQLAEKLQLSSQTRISEYENGTRKPSKQTTYLLNLIKEGRL